MPRILSVLVDTRDHPGRELLLGILRGVRPRLDWEIRTPAWSYDAETHELVRKTINRPDALIIRSDRAEIAAAAAHLPFPVVEVGRPEDAPPPPLRIDERAVGAAGAQHLAVHGWRPAAVMTRQTAWAAERLAGFSAAVRGEPQVLVHETTRGPEQARRERARRAAWIATLPPGTGIFAVDDHLALLALHAAADAGVDVPGSVGVVGANDDPLAGGTAPLPLSSVRLPHRELGEAAVAQVEARFAGVRAEALVLPPLGTTCRASTRRSAVDDPLLAAALERIAKDYADFPGVGALASALGVDRRQLERRFRSRLGVSVLDAVVRERVAAAKRLALAGDAGIDAIARSVGYRGRLGLERAFAAQGEGSPGRWRRARLAAHGMTVD